MLRSNGRRSNHRRGSAGSLTEQTLLAGRQRKRDAGNDKDLRRSSSIMLYPDTEAVDVGVAREMAAAHAALLARAPKPPPRNAKPRLIRSASGRITGEIAKQQNQRAATTATPRAAAARVMRRKSTSHDEAHLLATRVRERRSGRNSIVKHASMPPTADLNISWWQTHGIAVGSAVEHPERGHGVVLRLSPDGDGNVHIAFGKAVMTLSESSWRSEILSRVGNKQGVADAVAELATRALNGMMRGEGPRPPSYACREGETLASALAVEQQQQAAKDVANITDPVHATLEAAVAKATHAARNAADGFWSQLAESVANDQGSLGGGGGLRKVPGFADVVEDAMAAQRSASGSTDVSPATSPLREKAADGRVHVAFDGGSRSLYRRKSLQKYETMQQAVRAQIDSWWSTQDIAVGDVVVHPWRGSGVVRLVSPQGDQRIHVEFAGEEVHRYKKDSWFTKIRRKSDTKGIAAALAAFCRKEYADDDFKNSVEEEEQAAAATQQRMMRRLSSAGGVELLAERQRQREAGVYLAESSENTPRTRGKVRRAPGRSSSEDIPGGREVPPGSPPRALDDDTLAALNRAALHGLADAADGENAVLAAGHAAALVIAASVKAPEAKLRPFQPNANAAEAIEEARKTLRELEYIQCGADVRVGGRRRLRMELHG